METTLADRRPVFALLAAEGISQVGNMMTVIAGPWFVLQTTGSAAKTGLVSAALAIGAVVPTVLGGPVVDRLGYRRGSFFADLLSAATVASVPTLHLLGLLEFWHLVLLVFLLASINSQGDTSRFSLVPALAERAGMPLQRVNARDRAVVRFGQVLGPFLGGVLVAAIGAVNVLFVDAATFCLSAAAVAFGVPRDLGAPARAAAGRRRYLAELAEGMRFMRAKPFLLSMVLVATIGNFLDKPLLTVVAPVYAKRIYGSPASLGALVGAFGAGALIGSLLFGAVGRTWSRRRTFLTCYVLGPLLIFGTLALQPPLAVAILAALAAGLAFGPVNPIFATVTQEHTPPHLLGRVFGALTALASAGVPIGAVIIGVVIQNAGLIPTIVGMGVVYVVVTLTMFLNPALRRMDAPPGLGAAVEAPVHPSTRGSPARTVDVR